MKAELEQKSVDLLNWLEQTIKTTVDFGAEQIPLFIQELLRYNYWMSLTTFIISVAGLLLSFYAAYRFIIWGMHNNEDALPFSLVFLLPIIVCSAWVCHSTEWIMIQLAPRVYLLEYVKEMIKHYSIITI